MRILPFALLPVLAVTTNLAHADTLPVGNYFLSGQTTATGIHTTPDQGTLSGYLTFNPNSTLTAADLTFNDVTAGQTFSFTKPGPTTIIPGQFLSSTISNALNSAETYAFSIRIAGSSPAIFSLTCGVDCDTDAEISVGGNLLNEENTGTISAVPEPSSLLLLGTGLLGSLAAARRRLLNR